MSQALDLTTDLKLAHYMKIPPKAMFLTQLLGTAIGCVVNLAVVRLVLNPDAGYRAFIDGTKVDPTAQWDGRKIKIFYSASIIWGAIGPMEFFSGPYRKLYWGFLLGLLAPFIPWLLNKRWPRKYWSFVNIPVLLHGAGGPPQVPTNVSAHAGGARRGTRLTLIHCRSSCVALPPPGSRNTGLAVITLNGLLAETMSWLLPWTLAVSEGNLALGGAGEQCF